MPNQPARTEELSEPLPTLDPAKTSVKRERPGLSDQERKAKAKEVSNLARDALRKQSKAAKKATKAVDTAAPPSQDRLGAWSIDMGDQLQALMKSNSAFLDGTTNLGWEAFDFTSRRLRHDFETLDRLGKCESPREVFEVQSKFAEVLVDSYLEESSRLMGLMTASCDAWRQPWQDCAKRVLQNTEENSPKVS